MNQDKSHLSMDSMTKSSESMATPTHGSTALKYSTILELPLLWKENSSASMVDFLLKLKQSIKSEQFNDAKKSHMKVLFATSCGLIQKTLRLGPCRLEELDGCSDQK